VFWGESEVKRVDLLHAKFDRPSATQPPPHRSYESGCASTVNMKLGLRAQATFASLQRHFLMVDGAGSCSSRRDARPTPAQEVLLPIAAGFPKMSPVHFDAFAAAWLAMQPHRMSCRVKPGGLGAICSSGEVISSC
jgi:hypothetical protein